MIVLFFFKQKTAYEMRISDWSSDVCSSDLPRTAMAFTFLEPITAPTPERQAARCKSFTMAAYNTRFSPALPIEQTRISGRSEERRVGQECVCTCRSRLSPYHQHNNTNTKVIKRDILLRITNKRFY